MSQTGQALIANMMNICHVEWYLFHIKLGTNGGFDNRVQTTLIHWSKSSFSHRILQLLRIAFREQSITEISNSLHDIFINFEIRAWAACAYTCYFMSLVTELLLKLYLSVEMVFEGFNKALLYYYAHAAFGCVVLGFLNIAWHIPILKQVVVVWFNWVSRIEMPISQYWDTLFTWKMMKTYLKILHRDYVDRKAKTGEIAPNPPLVSVDGKTRCRILDLARGSRPLVLNFGNYTWPPFIAKLQAFSKLIKDFADVADFAIIYIAEAHPSDGWYFNVSFFRNHLVYFISYISVFLFISFFCPSFRFPFIL